MTTNCSLIDDQLIEMMKKHNFRLRLSFDGNKKSHELNRHSKGSKVDYYAIMNNIIKIKNNGIHYTVRMTVAANTISYISENIRYLHENGLNNISMVLDINMRFTKELQEEYKKQISIISEYYLEQLKINNPFTIDCFDGKLFGLLGKYDECFAMCGAGRTSLCIMPNGNIYPCSYLTNNTSFCIGDVSNGIDREASVVMAKKLYNTRFTKCNNCYIRSVCHGMKCGYLNYQTSGYINVPSELTCLQEKIIFPILSELITEMIKQKDIDFGFLHNYIAFIEKDDTPLSQLGKTVKDELESRKNIGE